MKNFVRGSIRATMVEGAVRISAPTKVRGGVRVLDINPTTATHLAKWILDSVPAKGVAGG